MLSYSLEVSDGEFGPFTSVYGDSVDTMILSYVLKNLDRGVTYRLRYRARNVIGWSDYSPIGYLLAAQVPAQCQTPVYQAATDQSI